MIGYRQRLEKANRTLVAALISLASVAGGDIGLDRLDHLGPEVVSCQGGVGLVDTKVASYGSVMMIMKKASA